MQFCLFTVVLVLTGGGLGGCGTCFNTTSVVEVDAHIEHYIFRKVRSQSLYSCASACLMSSVCMSFNFETKTRICELNSNSSNQVAVTTQPGFLFSDINHWPKSLAGACSATPCPTSRCQLDRLGRASCETEFQGCDAPPSVANAELHYAGVYEGAVAEYTCKDNFMMCTDRNQRVCQLTGNWNGSVGPCAQYSWDNPVMNFLMVVPCGNSMSFKVAMNITPTAVNRVYMDVRGGGNRLYHIGFRLDQNKVVFNSHFSGVWETDIMLSPVPLAVGSESLVEIRLDQGMYMLAVDGSSINNFTDRYPNEIREDILISGDAILTAAHITI
ncbi:uncharacterized protein LOC124120447 [Haliotis rufescens]|uniref:uncharacterized protein LOC124120447 n=1 Tax=Haliotis rufescens TaxID=6454 RepID=UPI00201F6DC3|nr:uncharacterized protein LOC124120447 [Haliotis rufescens]